MVNEGGMGTVVDVGRTVAVGEGVVVGVLVIRAGVTVWQPVKRG